MDIALLKNEIKDLATMVEEGARANKGNIKRFTEPAEGTLRRALAKRHHLIFGRRGSGKSSLLYKAAYDLSEEEHPVAVVDLEPFKGHHYPDIIISTLIAALKKFANWLRTEISVDKGKRVWYKFWKKNYSTKTLAYKKLKNKIDQEIEELVGQLYSSDNAKLKKKLLDHVSKQSDSQIKGKFGNDAFATEVAIGEMSNTTNDTEIQEEFKRSKKDYLLRGLCRTL